MAQSRVRFQKADLLVVVRSLTIGGTVFLAVLGGELSFVQGDGVGYLKEIVVAFIDGVVAAGVAFFEQVIRIIKPEEGIDEGTHGN
jgi:hypothetical protein